MSRRERETRIRLDGRLSNEHLEIVRTVVMGELIGSAGDLRLLSKLREPKQAVREVAALGRLAFGLRHGEILVPDQIARHVMSRLAAEVDAMNERGDIDGGDPQAEHDAMHAFLSLLPDVSSSERSNRVSLAGLGDKQLAILREGANQWLVAKAEDLPRAAEDGDGLKREIEEIAALGQLVSGLWRGELVAPDRIVRDLIARSASETIHLDELKEEYDRELAEYKAWVALLARFDRPVVSDPDGDHR